MRWSFSAHRSFGKCPRQWFYGSVLANARARDPLRQEAYRLSKLESIYAWRGKIVDITISNTIVSSIKWGRPCDLAAARGAARKLFEQQLSQRTGNAGGTLASDAGPRERFLEIEYGLPLTDEKLAQAWADVETALTNFYRDQPLWQLLQHSTYLLPQRPLSFKLGDVSVQVLPDLIAFRSGNAPTILDWKVNTRPLRDYWLQLALGAIALTRCTPHRDWPAGAADHHPQDIQLLEIQLLTSDTRVHKLTEADIDDLEDLVAISADEMQLAGGDEGKTMRTPESYPVAYDPRTCETCSFRKMCWESAA